METLKDLDLVRAVSAKATLRAAADDTTDETKADMPTMDVDFSVFNSWYEIDSWYEGQFMERTVSGSFKKTIKENRNNIKVLFDHGMDFQIGNKVLGPIEKLSEESDGPHAEVPLFDTTYNRDLLPGLEAGVYGSSFRFRVIKEEWNDEPGVSDHNPKGLPERSIKEVKLMEFGPVTFPANPESTAGVRSLTDEFLSRAMQRNPGVYDDLVARATQLRVPKPAVETDTAKETRKDTPVVETEAVKDETVEPIDDHSGSEATPLKRTISPARVSRKAAFMGDYLAIIMKGSDRYDG